MKKEKRGNNDRVIENFVSEKLRVFKNKVNNFQIIVNCVLYLVFFLLVLLMLVE